MVRPLKLFKFDPHNAVSHYIEIMVSAKSIYFAYLWSGHVIEYYSPYMLIDSNGVLWYAMAGYNILRQEHGLLLEDPQVDEEAISESSIVKIKYGEPLNNYTYTVSIEYNPEFGFVEVKPDYWRKQLVDIDVVRGLFQYIADSIRRRGKPYTINDFVFALSDDPLRVPSDGGGEGRYLIVASRESNAVVAIYATFPQQYDSIFYRDYPILVSPEIGFRYNVNNIRNMQSMNPMILYQPKGWSASEFVDSLTSAIINLTETINPDILYGAAHNLTHDSDIR